jgi:hypothetical protein
VAVELLTDPEPLTVEPEEIVPPGDAAGGVVDVTPLEVDGELTLPDPGELTGLPDGELVLRPVPLELVVPVLPLLTVPEAPPLPMEPEAPAPDVVGDADGA